MTSLKAGSATDVGLIRANNQDALLVGTHLFAVADGMGGHVAGEVASATAVTALHEAFEDAGPPPSPQAVSAAVNAANRAVWEKGLDNPELRGMGTTLVALALVRDDDGDRLAVANVGDSRVYLLREGRLRQLTDDHSLVAELVAKGRLDADEAEFHPQRHVLTRALGVDPEVDVDLSLVAPHPDDRYVLCSDGLSREVSDEQIASVLQRLKDPDEAAAELVGEARMRGGSDNITVVVVDVTEGGGPPGGDPVPDRESDETAAAAPADREADETVGTAAADRVVSATSGGATESGGPDGSPGRRRSRLVRSRAVTSRLITLRVAGFLLALLGTVVLAGAAIGWYARSSYFVGLRGDHLTIYQGRPGGLLWFQPTIAEPTGVTTGQVEARHLDELRAGKPEDSLGAARRYVGNLTREYAAARAAGTPPTSPGSKSPSTTGAPAGGRGPAMS